MKLKKMAAALTAIACCAGIMPDISLNFGGKTIAAELVTDNFEISYDGWYENADNVRLETVYGIGNNESKGMLVTGREAESDGASSKKGFYLVGGEKYNYSMQVYSEKTETFHISITCADIETGKTTVKELVSQTVEGGKWTTLSADYTAPENSGDFMLDITTDSTNDFAFDNVSVTQQVKEGAMQAEAADLGLKDIYGGCFRVGNILNGNTVNNSAIKNILLKDCNGIECENETKPDATLVQSQCSGTNIGVSLSSCASIFDFCAKNGLGVRGHTLVWHSQTPEWFFKENFNQNGNWVSSNVMDQRMENYIKNMFGAIEKQYPNLDLYAYDVCNECISDDSNRTGGGKDGAREAGIGNGKSPWVQVYGNNSFIEKAFTYARKYAPEGCDLYYNDYNEYWDHKRDCIYNMAKNLYNKGLLDGVGMQSHINADYNGFSGVDSYVTAMKKYLSIGCDVQVTELDITEENGKFSDQDQAKKYKAIFDAAVDFNTNPISDGRVTAVCVWGPNDANSWLSAGSNGLLYNGNNQPKAAYTALMQREAVSSTPAAPVEAGADGIYNRYTFESSEEGWSNRGSATVEVSGSEGFNSSKSLYVSGRTDSWNGAIHSLSRNPFAAGETFSLSANVMYTSGSATDTFYMKLEYTDSDGETKYDPIAEAVANKGEWVQLSNTSYTIPSGASDYKVYVETAESTNSFYLDDVVFAVKGTKVDGAGEAKKYMLGDLDGSGDIDAFDVAILRKVVNGKAKSSYADIDQSQTIDQLDVEYLRQYVTGEISEFPVNKPPAPEHRLMSEYTDVVSKTVVNIEPNDSHNEKSGTKYGTVKSGTYYSSTCRKNKPYNILLPAGYSEDKEYPVLYVMHGYWETQDRMIKEGNGTMYTRQIIGNAIASGEAEDMIVVFPYIYSSATQDSCSGMDDANNQAYDNFINDLIKDLMPHIEQTYSVKTGRDNTAITGFSMGGRESLLIGMQRPDLFGYVGAICPAPGVTGSFKWKSEEEAPYLLFITAGSNDEVVYTTPSGYHDNFTKNGVPHVWHYVNGGYHGDNSIHAHIYNFVRAVFKA